MRFLNRILKKKEVHNMKFNVINNSPNVNVEVKDNLDGSVAIIVDVKPNGKPLSEYKPGKRNNCARYKGYCENNGVWYFQRLSQELCA